MVRLTLNVYIANVASWGMKELEDVCRTDQRIRGDLPAVQSTTTMRILIAEERTGFHELFAVNMSLSIPLKKENKNQKSSLLCGYFSGHPCQNFCTLLDYWSIFTSSPKVTWNSSPPHPHFSALVTLYKPALLALLLVPLSSWCWDVPDRIVLRLLAIRVTPYTPSHSFQFYVFVIDGQVSSELCIFIINFLLCFSPCKQWLCPSSVPQPLILTKCFIHSSPISLDDNSYPPNPLGWLFWKSFLL